MSYCHFVVCASKYFYSCCLKFHLHMMTKCSFSNATQSKWQISAVDTRLYPVESICFGFNCYFVLFSFFFCSFLSFCMFPVVETELVCIHWITKMYNCFCDFLKNFSILWVNQVALFQSLSWVRGHWKIGILCYSNVKWNKAKDRQQNIPRNDSRLACRKANKCAISPKQSKIAYQLETA